MPMTPEKERELVEAIARAFNPECFEPEVVKTYGDLWALRQQDKQRHFARAALSIAAPILRDEAARDAFSAGFWAWNGPSNEAELDRDIAMEQEAWEEYAASLKTKDTPE